MPQVDFKLVTSANFPMYSESKDTDNAVGKYNETGKVGSKKRHLFTHTYPAARSGHASFYCVDKADFKALSGDAISLRMSFQVEKPAYTGNIGLFAYGDKSKLEAKAAAAIYTGSPGGNNLGVDSLHEVGCGLMCTKNSEGDGLRIHIGREESAQFPAEIGTSNEYKCDQTGDWQSLRLDIIPFTQNGVEMVKIEQFQTKRSRSAGSAANTQSCAWPTDAEWRNAAFIDRSSSVMLKQLIFDYDDDGTLAENNYGSGANSISGGDPVEGANMICGFYFGGLNHDGGNQQNYSSNDSAQAAASQISIGKFEMRVVSNTDAI